MFAKSYWLSNQLLIFYVDFWGRGIFIFSPQDQVVGFVHSTSVFVLNFKLSKLGNVKDIVNSKQ